jgi:hypothetical protein
MMQSCGRDLLNTITSTLEGHTDHITARVTYFVDIVKYIGKLGFCSERSTLFNSCEQGNLP